MVRWKSQQSLWEEGTSLGPAPRGRVNFINPCGERTALLTLWGGSPIYPCGKKRSLPALEGEAGSPINSCGEEETPGGGGSSNYHCGDEGTLPAPGRGGNTINPCVGEGSTINPWEKASISIPVGRRGPYQPLWGGGNPTDPCGEEETLPTPKGEGGG
jgi:hypothetical protein